MSYAKIMLSVEMINLNAFSNFYLYTYGFILILNSKK